MGDLARRLKALEEGVYAGPGILAVSLRESGLRAPEYHWRRALARANPAELMELERCRDAAEEVRREESGRLHDPAELAHLKIAETIMSRESETLANDFRVRRDLLWRALTRLGAEWRSRGRHKSTSYSDRPFWNVATAEASRRTAVNRGAGLVTDPEEVGRLIEQIADPATTTKVVLRLIGWRG